MKPSRKFLKVIFFAGVLLAFTASSLSACPSCGSANGDMPASPLTDGMNLGILTLFGVIAAVLGSIASFFIFIIRREGALARIEEPQNLSEAKV